MPARPLSTQTAGAVRPSLREQFAALDLRDPSAWPLLPRLVLCASVALCIVVVVWFGLVMSSADELRAAEDEVAKLKADYTRKLGQAANLGALRKQRERVFTHVQRLETQLPGRSEMDALLSDINQAGLSRRLVFDLFRPGPVTVRDYYAEQPIALRVTGRYHDVGAFAADIAGLSRIVTLNNLTITPAKDGLLVMEATAKTFRYLDPEEAAARRPAGAASASPARAGGRP